MCKDKEYNYDGLSDLDPFWEAMEECFEQMDNEKKEDKDEQTM